MAVLFDRKLSVDEFKVLCEAWHDLALDKSDEAFLRGVKAHCLESKFFPCPADILGRIEAWEPTKQLEIAQ